eukprot:COSAG04_NODE_481_length_13663_cov_9.055662_7_plen_224_part_00
MRAKAFARATVMDAVRASRGRRRLERVAAHVAAATIRAPAPLPRVDQSTSDAELRRLFGAHAYSEGPLAGCGAGRRFVGIDLEPELTPPQITFLLDALSAHRIISISGQDLERFSLAHFERFANHWGAILPHPKNCVDPYVKGPPGSIEFLPFDERRVARVNETFPGKLEALPHDTPSVLMISNFGGPVGNPSMPAGGPVMGSGGGFHTGEHSARPILRTDII